MVTNSVTAYTDTDKVFARGTPMERPKIGNSILDVIGATPMVKFSYIFITFKVLLINYIKIRLNRLAADSTANIFLKLESMEVNLKCIS